MIKLKLSLLRKDDLDIERFPYDDKEAFRKAVSLTGPQDSLVDFLKVFPNICYIIRYNDERMACKLECPYLPLIFLIFFLMHLM